MLNNNTWNGHYLPEEARLSKRVITLVLVV